MSVLSVPRIYFKGSMFWDPDTANNDAANYDEKTNTVVLQSGTTYDTYKEYMMEYVDWPIEGQPTTKNIRSNNWAFYGDHSCGFVNSNNRPDNAPYVTNVAITGGTLTDGSYISNDSLCGKEIQILGNKFNDRPTAGRLVDSNPYGSQSSQIFFSELGIGDETTGIIGSRQRRMYSYWVGVTRSLDSVLGYLLNFSLAGKFGAVWQTAIPFDQLNITNTGNSQLITQLQAAMQEPDALGLMIRFTAQNTLYYVKINPDDPNDIPSNSQILSNGYLNNEVIANPAYSYAVGSIGVWKQGELATAPAGLYLSSENGVNIPGENDPVDLGPLLAELDESRSILSLDALSTFPNSNQNGDISKYGEIFDFGSVVLKAGDTEISTLDYSQYNQAAYEQYGGIIDITGLDPAQISAIQSNLLSLEVPNTVNSGPTLQEQNLTALSNDRSIYIEESESETCTVQVRDRGASPPSGTRLFVAQYKFESGWVYVTPDDDSRYVDISGNVESGGWMIDLDTQGLAEITLTSMNPGCVLISFFPLLSGEEPPSSGDLPNLGGVPWFYFSIIRVMPFDNNLGDPIATPDDQLTWQFMYDNVFRVYDLAYPVMSEIIPMKNRALMEGAYMQIQAVIGDPDLPHEEDPMWQSTMYMSITRDLSKGKRQLLDRWCNLVSRGNQPD